MIPFTQVSPTDLAIVFATLMGPILAVQAQKVLERRQDATRRRYWIFRTLMSTRAARLSTSHIEALNTIDVEFYEKGRFKDNRRFSRVRKAWRAYFDHLSTSEPKDQSLSPVFYNERNDLFCELLYEMAQTLKYDDLDKTFIKTRAYSTVLQNEIDNDQVIIRKSMVEILSGKKPLPVSVIEAGPEAPEANATGANQ